MGSIVFAFGYATAVFHSYEALYPKNVETFLNVSLLTTVSGLFMCFLTAIFGYFSFKEATKSNILLNFGGTVGVIFKLLVVVHLILYIPGDFVIMRCSCLKLIRVEDKTLSNVKFILVSVCLLCLVTVLATVLQIYYTGEALSMVLDITGGLAGSMIYFILPGLSGIVLMKNDSFDYFKCFILASFGTSIFIFCGIVAYAV
jgi:uncharacterized membrane protein